jgi:hypothetical protein
LSPLPGRTAPSPALSVRFRVAAQQAGEDRSATGCFLSRNDISSAACLGNAVDGLRFNAICLIKMFPMITVARARVRSLPGEAMLRAARTLHV